MELVVTFADIMTLLHGIAGGVLGFQSARACLAHKHSALGSFGVGVLVAVFWVPIAAFVLWGEICADLEEGQRRP